MDRVPKLVIGANSALMAIANRSPKSTARDAIPAIPAVTVDQLPDGLGLNHAQRTALEDAAGRWMLSKSEAEFRTRVMNDLRGLLPDHTHRQLVLTKAIGLWERGNLRKGGDKPPAGFSPIPNSTKGGFRKQSGGGFIYWYPGVGITRGPKEATTPKPGFKQPKKPVTAQPKEKSSEPVNAHDGADHGALTSAIEGKAGHEKLRAMMAEMVRQHGVEAVQQAAHDVAGSMAEVADHELQTRAGNLDSHEAVQRVVKEHVGEGKRARNWQSPKKVAQLAKALHNDAEVRHLAEKEIRQVIPKVVDAGADAAVQAVEGGEHQPSKLKAIARLVLKSAAGSFAFGFIDNFMLYIAGASVDKHLAVMGLGAAAVAGVGNAISDAVGEAGSGLVEKALEKLGLGEDQADEKVLSEKTQKRVKAAARIGGVFVGALCGMVPLLFGVKFGKSVRSIPFRRGAGGFLTLYPAQVPDRFPPFPQAVGNLLMKSKSKPIPGQIGLFGPRPTGKGGEQSRGGRVVGHRPSGRAIYASEVKKEAQTRQARVKRKERRLENADIISKHKSAEDDNRVAASDPYLSVDVRVAANKAAERHSAAQTLAKLSNTAIGETYKDVAMSDKLLDRAKSTGAEADKLSKQARDLEYDTRTMRRRDKWHMVLTAAKEAVRLKDRDAAGDALIGCEEAGFQSSSVDNAELYGQVVAVARERHISTWDELKNDRGFQGLFHSWREARKASASLQKEYKDLEEQQASQNRRTGLHSSPSDSAKMLDVIERLRCAEFESGIRSEFVRRYIAGVARAVGKGKDEVIGDLVGQLMFHARDAAYLKQQTVPKGAEYKVRPKLIIKGMPTLVAMLQEPLIKGGPYIGPKGGKWDDPQHTIPWKGETGKHTYGAIHRPVSSVTVPKGHTETGKHSDFKKFGTVTYDKPLSAKDQEHYSLIHIPEKEHHAQVVAKIAEQTGMDEYPEEWIEEYEDDPKSIEIGVGQAIDKLNIHAERKAMTKDVMAFLQRKVEKGKSKDADADALAQLPKDKFIEQVKGGVTVKMFRGTSEGAHKSGPKWFASQKKTAERYAGESTKHTKTPAVVHEETISMKRPYVAKGIEIINASKETISRLQAEGYDGMIAQFGGGIKTKSNPNPRAQLYAVVFGFKKSLFDTLIKGAGHKYLKRVPRSSPPPKWRYVYQHPKRKGLTTSDDLHAGVKVQVEHEGKRGHLEVIEHQKDRGIVKMRHDESGKTIHVREHDLHRMVTSHHKRKAKTAADKEKQEFLPYKMRREAKQEEIPGAKTPPKPRRGKVTTISKDDLPDYDEIIGFVKSEGEAQILAGGTKREVAIVEQPGGFVVAARDRRRKSKAGEAQGSPTTVYMRDKSGKGIAELDSEYVVMEADDVIASHDPESKQPRADYPEGVQEREYHELTGEKLKVERIARELKPRMVANTNPDAVNGAPIVTEDGIVLGGNGRTMGMQLAYKQRPESGEKLKTFLAQHAKEFGLRPSEIEGIKQPILVRRIKAGKDPKKLLALGRRMNESLTQGLDPRAMEVALGRNYVDRNLTGALVARMDMDQTLNDFLGSAASKPFLDALESSGIIDERNREEFTDEKTGLLNEDGRLRVERVIAARMLPDAGVLRNLNQSTRQNLAGSVPYLLRAEEAGWDLRESLMTAAKADINYRSQRKYGTPAQYLQQVVNEKLDPDHPGLSLQKDEMARHLFEILQRFNGPKKMAAGFRDFARRAETAKHIKGVAGGGLFAETPETASEALDRAFGIGKEAAKAKKEAKKAAKDEEAKLAAEFGIKPKAKKKKEVAAGQEALLRAVESEPLSGGQTGAVLMSMIAREINHHLHGQLQVSAQGENGFHVDGDRIKRAVMDTLLYAIQTDERVARALGETPIDGKVIDGMIAAGSEIWAPKLNKAIAWWNTPREFM